MPDSISDNLIIMLTGTTMSIIGGLITGFFYKPTNTAFVSARRFKTKYQALAIFLIAIIVTSYVSVSVQNFWTNNTPPLDLLVGLILIIGMRGVNYLVKMWKYDDKKSCIVYAIGLLIILLKPISNLNP